MTGRPHPAEAALAAELAGRSEPTIFAADLPAGLLDEAVARAAVTFPWAETRDGRMMLTVALAGVLDAGWIIREPGDLGLDTIPHARHRKAEPETSVEAARRAMPTARSVAFAILRALRAQEVRAASADAEPGGFTADELADKIGKPVWRRVSDLENLGLIEPVPDDRDPTTPRTRAGRSGTAQRVHRLTDAGRRYVATLSDVG